MARPPAPGSTRAQGRVRHGRFGRLDAEPRGIGVDGRDRRPGRGRRRVVEGAPGVVAAVIRTSSCRPGDDLDDRKTVILALEAAFSVWPRA